MPGQIKHLIDSIIRQRAKGDPLIVIMTKSKLVLRGVDPERFNDESEDDSEVLAIIRAIATELGTDVEPRRERIQPCP